MNINDFKIISMVLVVGLGSMELSKAALRDDPDAVPMSSDMSDEQAEELMRAQEALESLEGTVPSSAPQRRSRKSKKNILSGEEGFIADPNWEFDGFVVGGMGQRVRSMFVVNDLIYLNVGFSQGIQSGDRLGFYKRGKKIKDPQSGRFLGYEVSRVGTGEVTNKIEDETCSVRIITSNIGIEIGDLVRRDQ